MPMAITLPGPFEIIVLAMFVTVPITLIALLVFLVGRSQKKR